MSKTLKIGLVGVLVVSVLAMGLVGMAMAQEPPDDAGKPAGFPGRIGFGVPFDFGGSNGDQWTIFDTVADVLGLTPEGLFSELHSGKSVSDVADEQGVDAQAIQDAIQEVRADAIQQAVEDGKITQEQADRMLARMSGEKPEGERPEPPSEEEMTQARTDAINQAVEDGKISQEQADWMLEGLENGWGFGPFGFGERPERGDGPGFGGHGMMNQ